MFSCQRSLVDKMKKKKNRKPLIILIAIFLLLLYSPIRDNIRKILFSAYSKPAAVLSEKGRKAKSYFSFIFHISDLKKQNDELTQKIQSMDVDQSKISELEYENEELKKELGYAETNPGLKLLSTKIIGREPTSFLDYVIVDKGSNDNIKTGMPVISGGVLIGQVKEVFPDQSRVTLITSKDSLIMAMLQNSRSKGILKGGISGLTLENITQDVTYEKGEYVVTSGLDGELPPGILIGKTGSLESSSSDLYKNISIESAADLSRLELVFIIIE